MAKILQINSGVLADNSQSNQLADQFAQQWLAAHPGHELLKRDLANENLPHLDLAFLTALGTDPAQRNPEQQERVALADQIIEQVEQAEVLVIGLPLYNFGVPSQLKSYFDYLCRAGRTFNYTEQGPVGLLQGKKAYVLAARGGVYSNTPGDTQTAFVQQLLGFLGFTQVEFIYAEGLNMGEEARTQALAAANQAIAAAVAS